jgi:hypothetical protein
MGLARSKFRDCVSFARQPANQSGAERVIEMVHNLDCADDASEILHLFG